MYSPVRNHLSTARGKFKIPKLLPHLLFCYTAVVASPSLYAEENSNLYISDAQAFEVIEQVKASGGDDIELTFQAYSRTFTLLLHENKRLLAALDPASKSDNVTLYAGRIEGIEGSWARINRTNGQFSGAVYDGKEMYLIDSASVTASSLDKAVRNSLRASNTLVYRASDIVSGQTCGADENDPEAFSYEELVTELQQTMDASANAARQQVNLDIFADTEFVRTSNGDPRGQVLAQMNIVDGIFSEQVGVKFNINNITPLADNGRLRSTDPSTLLSEFRNFVGRDNPGLAHLFSGKNLNGSTIGIAFINGICRTTGVGVTQAGGQGVFGALTAAHEFGHNFGAPHDNQRGSACANTNGSFLMNPSLNGNDQFSQCSLEQMAEALARVSCLEPVDSTPPPPNPEPVACNFSADFSRGTEGFAFVDDPQTPRYTSGASANGSLIVDVGGVDNATVNNMTGAWRRDCTAEASGEATITLTGVLSQAANYEANEFSEIALRVNGNTQVLDRLTGDGNGGRTKTTGNQTHTARVALKSGTNSIELLCTNNRKTFADERSRCSFSSLASAVGGNGGNNNGDGINDLTADFDTDTNGFTFEGAANTPDFADGNFIVNGGVDDSGALQIRLGGVDNADITNMEANWTRTFSASGPVTLSLQAKLSQTSEYERDETSRIAVIVDGQLHVISTLAGNGNGGRPQSTGFQTFTLPLNLSSGTHTVSLNCFNNKKTLNDESTTCVFDNLTIQ